MSKRPELVGKDRTSTVPVATSLCDNCASQSAREAHHAEGIHEMEENRKKALAAALGQIEKQFGKGSVMRLGDAAATPSLCRTASRSDPMRRRVPSCGSLPSRGFLRRGAPRATISMRDYHINESRPGRSDCGLLPLIQAFCSPTQCP